MLVDGRENSMDGVVQELDVDDDEERLQRVAAIDVAKASGNVCMRLPRGKRRVTKLWDVESTTALGYRARHLRSWQYGSGHAGRTVTMRGDGSATRVHGVIPGWRRAVSDVGGRV